MPTRRAKTKGPFLRAFGRWCVVVIAAVSPLWLMWAIDRELKNEEE